LTAHKKKEKIKQLF